MNDIELTKFLHLTSISPSREVLSDLLGPVIQATLKTCHSPYFLNKVPTANHHSLNPLVLHVLQFLTRTTSPKDSRISAGTLVYLRESDSLEFLPLHQGIFYDSA